MIILAKNPTAVKVTALIKDTVESFGVVLWDVKFLKEGASWYLRVFIDKEGFIINLEQVDYIDSSGIGALIYICSTIKKMNLKLAISNIHGSVKKVIELTKLMGYFPIANSVEEALLMIAE